MGVNFAEGGRTFSNPDRAFANLEPSLVASLVTASADIALLIDADGVVRDVAMRRNVCDPEIYRAWIDQPFADIVTSECRLKAKRLLSESDARNGVRREINHPIAGASDLPVSYSILRLSSHGGRVALGRDLRAASELQQRLISAQLHYDHEFERARGLETQYRMLFEASAHFQCILDPATRTIIEANAAARKLLNSPDPVGLPVENLFARTSLESLDRTIAAAYSSGKPGRSRLTLEGRTDAVVDVAVRFFRHLGQSRLSLELTDAGGTAYPPGEDDAALRAFAALGFASPDGMVVLDREMRIVVANRSYLDLVQIADLAQIVGRDVAEQIGRRGVEPRVLRSAIEQRGTVRNLATQVVPAEGMAIPVEIAGAEFMLDGRRHYGLSVRRSDRPLPATPANPDELRPANDMIGLVGKMPLRDIVRDTTDIIERLCIEAALELTGNNRASAAELLGLSRQALYTKLRRFGLMGETGDAL